MVKIIGRGKSDIVIGAIAGYILDYVWQAMALPGFGTKVFQLTAQSATMNESWLGYDELAEIGIGIAIATLFKHKYFGLGIVAGIVIKKLIEIFTVATTSSTTASQSGLTGVTSGVGL